MIRKISIITLMLISATVLVIIADTPKETAAIGAATTEPGTAIETIVIFRHGEKPADGLGNITPQGLNRALALSVVLPQRFGKPDYLFAPDPAQQVNDRGGSFNYVRPLATIEPTAIRLGMPVQTPYGYRDYVKLNDELIAPKYSHSLIFVAWEHLCAEKETIDLLKRFGADTSQVPSWPGNDYDSLYVVTIRHDPDNTATATFQHELENLNGQSANMPTPASN
jgi:hypothetical protein